MQKQKLIALGMVALVVGTAVLAFTIIILRQRCPSVQSIALPVYPGAIDISDVNSQEDPGTRAVSHLIGPGDLEEVAEYYKRAMLNNDWEYEGQEGVWQFFRYRQGDCQETLFVLSSSLRRETVLLCTHS
jgi:hypothetical protein